MSRARNVARRVRHGWEHAFRQPDDALEADAAAYWAQADGSEWRRNSHWNDGVSENWQRLGSVSLEQAERLVRVTGRPLPDQKTIEWGSGGGGQAVAFAPRCREFVAVDVVEASLDECERRVREVSGTKLEKVFIDLRQPERAIDDVGVGSCDLFLSYYVLELVPSQAYGYRILEIAHQLLRPGGVAILQIKYATSAPQTRSRRRAYKRDPATMTSYAIDEFWEAATERGFQPEVIELVPQDAFDSRYAYFLLSRI